MATQIKTFVIENPLDIEKKINAWLKESGDDIEICQIYPLPMIHEQKSCIQFIVIYKKIATQIVYVPKLLHVTIVIYSHYY